MMGDELVVPNIEELIAPKLKDGEKIVDTQITRFTAPGENYGSIILRLVITLEDVKTKKRRTLDTVGKTAPTSEYIRKVFETEVTFINEYKFYAEIVPALDTFLKNNNISTGADSLAPFVNGRLNLNGGEILGPGGIILLENLRTVGYSIGEKTIGLDLDHCRIVLKCLARFHAAGLGLKIKEPVFFEKKVKPYFYSYVPAPELRTMIKLNFGPTLAANGFSEEQIQKYLGLFEQFKKVNVSEIWGTLIHYDTWTNNFLINYKNGKPSHCILVDFQMFDYGTPLNDVMFFLFTSVQTNIFDSKLDYLLDYYFDTLLKDLETLNVDTSSFTRKSFEEEVIVAVKNYEYYHAMWMSQPIMVEQLTSLEELKKDDSNKLTNWSDAHVKKIVQITNACIQRKWI